METFWSDVTRFKDAEPVNADTFNVPVEQLTSRTDYLKHRLDSLMSSGVQSALVLHGVSFDYEIGDVPQPGDIVYRHENGFRKAQAKMHMYDDFSADESAFTIGVVKDVSKDTGDVLIYGSMSFDHGSGVTVDYMLQTGEEFRPGRYYLSATEPGKITAYPNGPLIYIGSFHSKESEHVAYVNPQFLDIGTSHVHRAYSLVARPAGSVVDGKVVGHFPNEGTGNERPSLILGGTWTSVNDATFHIVLGNTTDWGRVTLFWTKTIGDVESEQKSVKIPAPGVFVALEDGVKVKVNFPDATNRTAFVPPEEGQYTWDLVMPDAGKGWVNHDVYASGSSHDGSVSVRISGSWPDSSNEVECVFPGLVYTKAFTDIPDVSDTIKIGTVTYTFVDVSDSYEPGPMEVPLAGTLEETLRNLAAVVNKDLAGMEDPVPPSVFVIGDTIVTADIPIDSEDPEVFGDFDIVGGSIGCMLVYSRYYEIIGVVKGEDTFVPTEIYDGSLTASVYSTTIKESDTTPVVCKTGTRVRLSAYDYMPSARYDYVMGLHQEVDFHYPPVPAKAAGLFVNGVEMEGGALFPDNPTYVLGKRTIYWMKDDDDNRPWPKSVDNRYAVIDDPVRDKMMALYFVVGFQCATGPVTSLTTAPGAPLKLYSFGTNDEATTGDLMIDAAIDFNVRDSKLKGYIVPKAGRGGKLLAGPVVERIKAGPGVVVTSDPGCPDGYGTVTVGLDDGSMRSHFNEIALENAKQEKLGLFPYVSLLGYSSSMTPSGFTMMMRVPSHINKDTDYNLFLRMVMFGTVGYTGSIQQAAGIQLDYNILPDYTDDVYSSLKTGLLVPTDSRRIAVPLGHSLQGQPWTYTSFDPFVATNDPEALKDVRSDICVPFSELPIPDKSEFPLSISNKVKLKPGYMVAVRISRIATPTGNADVTYSPYVGPLGFLSMEWTLRPVNR